MHIKKKKIVREICQCSTSDIPRSPELEHSFENDQKILLKPEGSTKNSCLKSGNTHDSLQLCDDDSLTCLVKKKFSKYLKGLDVHEKKSFDYYQQDAKGILKRSKPSLKNKCKSDDAQNQYFNDRQRKRRKNESLIQDNMDIAKPMDKLKSIGHGGGLFSSYELDNDIWSD